MALGGRGLERLVGVGLGRDWILGMGEFVSFGLCCLAGVEVRVGKEKQIRRGQKDQMRKDGK